MTDYTDNIMRGRTRKWQVGYDTGNDLEYCGYIVFNPVEMEFIFIFSGPVFVSSIAGNGLMDFTRL